MSELCVFAAITWFTKLVLIIVSVFFLFSHDRMEKRGLSDL